MENDRKFITPKEAINLLNDGDRIHTFRDPSGMLMGCDVDRDKIIKMIEDNPDKLEIGGEGCRGMKHALVINDEGILFVETNEEKLNKFDPIKIG